MMQVRPFQSHRFPAGYASPGSSPVPHDIGDYTYNPSSLYSIHDSAPAFAARGPAHPTAGPADLRPPALATTKSALHAALLQQQQKQRQPQPLSRGVRAPLPPTPATEAQVTHAHAHAGYPATAPCPGLQSDLRRMAPEDASDEDSDLACSPPRRKSAPIFIPQAAPLPLPLVDLYGGRRQREYEHERPRPRPLPRPLPLRPQALAPGSSVVPVVGKPLSMFSDVALPLTPDPRFDVGAGLEAGADEASSDEDEEDAQRDDGRLDCVFGDFFEL